MDKKKEYFVISPADRDAFDAEIAKRNRSAAKEKVELIEKAILSQDLTKAFIRIHTDSRGKVEESNLEKVRIALGLGDKVENIGDRWLVYLGAGTDIEFAIATRARKIALIDPGFRKKKVREEIYNRIREFDENIQPIKQKGFTEVKFMFDFGKDKEEVNVLLVGKNAQDFHFDKPVGLAFSFLGTDSSSPYNNLQLMSLVHPGSIIFDNRFTPTSIKQNPMEYGLEPLQLEQIDTPIFQFK